MNVAYFIYWQKGKVQKDCTLLVGKKKRKKRGNRKKKEKEESQKRGKEGTWRRHFNQNQRYRQGNLENYSITCLCHAPFQRVFYLKAVCSSKNSPIVLPLLILVYFIQSPLFVTYYFSIPYSKAYKFICLLIYLKKVPIIP